jgi:hypothetical protein
MLLTTPIWLLGLLPWAAATLLLLLARRPRRDIPFLQLWQIEMPKAAMRRRFELPPIAVILGLLAALLAILAAAGPALRSRGSGVTMVVDAGATMSARGATRERFVELLASVARDLRQQSGGDLPVRLIVVPADAGSGQESLRTTAVGLDAAAIAIHPTAVATADEVSLAARQAASAFEEPVLVLSDRPLQLAAERMAQLAPDQALQDVGIARFSVRRSPRPQAMVRLARGGAAGGQKTAVLRITSGGKSQEQTIELPAAGATRDYFISLSAAGATATAEIVGWRDDFSGNDRADLVAEADWPVIEPLVPIGELRRLVDLYAAGRPAGERSIHVRLAGSEAQLKGAVGIILPPAASPATPTRATTVANHPITVAVGRWDSLDIPAVQDRTLPGTGWTVLLSDARGPLLAVRELGSEVGTDRPIRQVWTAFDVAGWANQPQYVVFWSAAIDWAGRVDAEGERLGASPLEELTAQWQPVELSPGPLTAIRWPGVYERQGDSARRAFGPAATLGPTLQLTAAERSARIAALLRQGEHLNLLAPWMLVGAMLFGMGAVLWWPRPGKRKRFRKSETE